MFDEMIESIREDTVKMMLIMPKRIYEIQKRQDAIAAAREQLRGLPLLHSRQPMMKETASSQTL